jgi:ferredoxin
MSVRTPEAYLEAEGGDLAANCTSCGKCFEICPIVSLPNLIN